jgi:hypothetical protein
MQCSAQALNLICANRVFIIDLWWNSAMEQQAFGRVHRMGQTKETHFARIMAKNTIDERLAALQIQKLRMINQTIKEFDSSKIKLTADEVLGLFGKVVADNNGSIVDIMPDYDDDDDDDEEEEQEAGEENETGSLDAEIGSTTSWASNTSLGDLEDL